MDKNNIVAAIIGIIIGLVFGWAISSQVLNAHKECTILKQENQMLRDMLFDQQDPYRPDTTHQPKEIEGCEL
jgi:hypothetical protein